MCRYARNWALVLLLNAVFAHADDGAGLQRGCTRDGVTISGVSAGAAMAVQYAIAHSQSISGVGVIAGPAWGCADGKISQAVNACMCGFEPVPSRTDAARRLAASGAIDPLPTGKPTALQRAFVFHSAQDRTVVAQSAKAGIAFLTDFTGVPPVVDWGNATDGSNQAGHGLVAPAGTDACRADGKEQTFVRRCGAEDNARDMLRALYPDVAFDPAKRVSDIPEQDVWPFDQGHIVEAIKASGIDVSPDDWSFFPPWTKTTARRANFDMAHTGYLYVPPGCRKAGPPCRLHVALHGCKQNAKAFAQQSGYNNWAELFRIVVIYPALEPSKPLSETCSEPVSTWLNTWWMEPNPNGCWDWWGYLDGGRHKNRYLTKEAPQMRAIEMIITEATGSGAPGR